MLRLAISKYGDLAPIPTFLRFIFPFASRPWRKRDLEEKPDTVPYLNGRGFVDFSPDDEEDPRNWGRARCWYICIVAIFIVSNGTISSGLSSGSITSIAEEFGVSQVAAGLTTTLFVLGYCAGPFVFAPLSEFYGRRWLVYVTFLAYLAFTVLCAFAPNFGSLLVGRFLSGTFIAAPLSATPGIIADLWEPLIRDNVMVLFAVSTWGGPSLGTVLAGLLSEAKNWRWAFYFSLMLGALTVLFMTTLPETLAVTILKEKAMRHRQARTAGLTTWRTDVEEAHVSLLATYKTALLRPWALLFDMISFLCAIYMGVIFLLQFMLFSIYPIVFQEIRGWSSAVAQLPLLGAVVGAVFAAIGILIDTQRRKRVFRRRGYLVPEDHLFLAKVGGVGFSATMFWFAWTGQFQSIHWIAPTLGGTFLSVSLMLVFLPFVNYLVQCYGHYSASIVAVNTFARSLGSAAAPLFTNAMFSAMGVGGGGSLIGGVAALLAICPFLFSQYGENIRAQSKYTAASVAKPPTEQGRGQEHPTSYQNEGEYEN